MKYLPQLTVTRFFAALIVVVVHYGQQASPFDEQPLRCLVQEGAVAVSYFFFLSGFVLSYNYLNIPRLNFREFWMKRIARIYPIYVLAFVVTLLSALWINGARPWGGSIILQLLGLHAWCPGIALEINFPGWSLSVELFFYFMFPFAALLLRKRSLSQFFLITLTVWLLSLSGHIGFIRYFHGIHTAEIEQFINCFPLWHFNVFLFGMFGGAIVLKWQERKIKLAYWPPFVAIAAGLLCWYLLCENKFVMHYNHNGLMAPLFFLIVIGLAMDRSLFAKILGQPLFVFLGNISYSIYILQFPVYLWFAYMRAGEIKGTVDFYSYLLILIAVSSLTYWYIEKTCRRWLISRFGQ